GRSGFERALGVPVFEFYARNPDAARIGAEGLTSRSVADNASVVAAYHFQGIRTVVDVGGGEGTLLAALLLANQNIQGLLFEKPHTVELSEQHFEQNGLRTRCEFDAGDFFESVFSGGVVYIFMNVIKVWDDVDSRI